MIIFGFGGGRPKDRGPVVPARCPNCGNENHLRHVSVTRWFSLFFIPLIPYSTKHFLLCPVCSQGRPLTREQAARAGEMVEATRRRQAGELSHEDYVARAAAFTSLLRPIDVAGADQPAPAPLPPPPGTPLPPPPSAPLPEAPPVEAMGPGPAAPTDGCVSCGCPLPDHARFCPNCGRPAD
ncbi:MAG: zinc-ribbon domain-containing protein [Microthrixaceae bacterium]|nr:zinc-ribbon domain-containing protein [Microthrixaceae bacterium]